MKLYDLQTYDPHANHDEMCQKHIDQMNERRSKNEISDAHYHCQMALSYSLMYRPEECKKHAFSLPDTASDDEKLECEISLARMFVFEKNIEDALAHYKKADTLDPNHVMVLEEAGWCSLELKLFQEAADYFKRGILEEPEWEVFHEGLAFCFAQQNKFEEAIPVFIKAMECCTDKSFHYYYHDLIGQSYAGLDNFYMALSHYTKCLDANPTYDKGLNDIASLYYNQEGDIENAIMYLKKAEAAAEESGHNGILQTIYINLARLYDKKKEFDLHEHYKVKLLEVLGFGGLFGDDDDEDYNEDEDDDGGNDENNDETGNTEEK